MVGRYCTLDLFSQNLHATHTNLTKSSGGPYAAVELCGDGIAVEHLATGTEAVNRLMARRLADVIYSPGPGEQYLAWFLRSHGSSAAMCCGGLCRGCCG
eukprot:6509074-Prymnesium_polylepis.1